MSMWVGIVTTILSLCILTFIVMSALIHVWGVGYAPETVSAAWKEILLSITTGVVAICASAMASNKEK